MDMTSRNIDVDSQTPQPSNNITPTTLKSSPFTNGTHKRHLTTTTPSPMVVSYKECLKNHAASLGGHALDGCGEFMPSSTVNPNDPSREPQEQHIITTVTATATPAALPSVPQEQDLQRFGVTDDLRSFVQGLTSTTFKHFLVNSDESEFEASDVPTSAANVRKDLNEFQEKHANLVLTTVKEISRLRYELCPRAMKERHFWRIYFTLVNTHVAPYEKKLYGSAERSRKAE